MATYLPGVRPFIPQTEVFTPDYKFLQDVLSVRQDRYDTNFQAINKLYGDVVYAPLSRQNNKDKRDQYANKLSNALKQVSGMDLSLQQNVQTAKALFDPFYKDTELVKDMLATKTFQRSQKDIERFKSSNDRDVRRNYWTFGEKHVNYKMQDFINGTDEFAKNFNIGDLKYQHSPDIFNISQEILDEAGLENTDYEIVKDYIIKIKNGPALTQQEFTYKDPEDGKWKTGRKNAAMDYVVQALKDDPRIQKGMQIRYEVEKREWAEENKDQFGGLYQAGLQFDKNILLESEDEDIRKLAELNTQLVGDEASLSNWLEYKKKYGIVTGSKEDETLMKKQYEVMLNTKTKNKINDRLVNLKHPTDDEKTITKNAMVGFISSKMQEEFFNASNAWANKTMSREISVDQAQQTNKRIAWEKDKFMMTEMNKFMLKEMDLSGTGGGNSVNDVLKQFNVSLNPTPSPENINTLGLIYGKLNENIQKYDTNRIDGVITMYKTSQAFREYFTGYVDTDGDGQKDSYLEGGGEGLFNIGTQDSPNFIPFSEINTYLNNADNAKELTRIFDDVSSKYSTLNDDVLLNDFMPADEIDFDVNTKNSMISILSQVEAYESGVNGTPMQQMTELNSNFADAYNWYLKSNPESDLTKNAYSGYLDLVTNEYKQVLETEGINSAMLNAGPNDLFPGTDIKIWDFIEEEAIKSKVFNSFQDDGTTPDYGKYNNFYDLVNNSSLVMRNPSNYLQQLTYSLQGQPSYDTNGDLVASGKDNMTAYLNEYYPDGPNDAFYQDSKFSNNGWSNGGNWLRQIVWKHGNNGWYFDDGELEKLAISKNGFYPETVKAINNTWSNEQSIPGGTVPYPSVLTNLYPDQQVNFGSNMWSGFTSFTTVDANFGNDEDAQVNFAGAVNGISNADHGNAIVLPGDYLSDKTLGEGTITDPVALTFLRDVVLPKLTNPKWLEENSVPLAYSQMSSSTYIDEATNEEKPYTVYTFTLPEKDLLADNKGFNPNGVFDEVDGFEESEIYTSRKISVLVRQDLDALVNNKNSANQNPSIFESIIKQEGKYILPSVGGGGSAMWYLGPNGEIIQSINPVKWDNTNGSYIPDPNYSTDIIDPAGLENNIYMTQDALIINRNNNKNIKNGSPNVDYNVSQESIYQAYPGGPYVPRQ